MCYAKPLLVFLELITILVSLSSTSCDSPFNAFESVLGVDLTWELPRYISSLRWEFLLAVF
jgi:hypothetical protein